MKRVIFAFGILVSCNLFAQSPKFIQQNNTNTYGEGLLDFDLKMYGGNSSSDPLNINCLFSITNGQLREPIENIKLSNIQLKGHYI